MHWLWDVVRYWELRVIFVQCSHLLWMRMFREVASGKLFPLGCHSYSPVAFRLYFCGQNCDPRVSRTERQFCVLE
jgi:hypothetical protein